MESVKAASVEKSTRLTKAASGKRSGRASGCVQETLNEAPLVVENWAENQSTFCRNDSPALVPLSASVMDSGTRIAVRRAPNGMEGIVFSRLRASIQRGEKQMIGALRIGVEYLAQTVIGLRLRGAVIAGRCAGQEQQGNQKKQNRQRPGAAAAAR